MLPELLFAVQDVIGNADLLRDGARLFDRVRITFPAIVIVLSFLCTGFGGQTGVNRVKVRRRKQLHRASHALISSRLHDLRGSAAVHSSAHCDECSHKSLSFP